MSFVEAADKTPAIRDHVRPGLQALTNSDRKRVTCDGRHLRGSVNIDRALSSVYPQDPRWDYAIGIGRPQFRDFVVWLEVHPASSLHVDGVIAKLNRLRRWLKTAAPELD